MHKKRYWIIGIFIFIILIGAIFGEVDDQDAGDQNKNKQTEEIEKKEREKREEKEKTQEKAKVEREEKEKKEEEKKEEESTEEKETTKAEKKEESPPSKSENLSNLKAHFIDAGQADATLFQYSDGNKQYNILFDAGDWNRKDVVSYLHSQSIKSLDLIVISHPHADHIGQLDDIMKQFTVHEVWMNGNTATSQTFQRAAEAVLSSNADYVEPRAGEVYDIGPLTLEILHPAHLTGDLNQDSLSIRFLYGNIAFLLTGDAYKQNELEMIRRNSSIKAEVLQLGHHGSNTSTDPRFLDAVNPKVAIYSAGSNNSYGHPHSEVVSLIKNKGIDLYGTDVHGTIVVTTNGKTLNVATKKDGTVTPKNTSSSNTSKKSKPSGKGKNSDSGSSNKSNHKKKEEPKKEQAKKQDPPPATANCVDINKASIEEVQQIIHIGPARAEDLVKLRPFKSVDDLTKISGIGPARIKDIKAEGIACVGG